MEQKIINMPLGKVPYLEGGKGKKVLFLHGAFAMPHAYDELFNLLIGDYHIIAPTHVGHGNAHRVPKIWVFQDMIDHYKMLLKKISFTPEIIIGHSLGGGIAISLSKHFPNSIVIAIDVVGFPLKPSLAPIIKDVFDEIKISFQKRPPVDSAKNLSKAANTILKTLVKHPEDIPYFYRIGPVLNLEKEFKTVDNKTYLLWGSNDGITPIENGLKIHKLLKNSIITIFKGKKHNYPITEPDFTYLKIKKAINIMNKK
ncbi:alpha/beta fold hydrolase [Patescibacteria group bacterium]